MNTLAVNALTDVLAGRMLVFLCVLARISGVVIVAPAPWTVAPVTVRAALVVLLSFVATVSPIGYEAHLSDQPLTVALAIVSEAGIGACMGMTVRLIIASAEVAADFISPQLGIGVAQLFDPHMHASETAVGSIFRNLALLLTTLVGLHRQLLAALFGSFSVLPPGVVLNPGHAGGVVLALTTTSIEAGARIALPTVAVLFMVQVALAFIARAAPALQVFSVGFAVTLGVGLLVIVVSLPDSVRLVLTEMSHLDSRLSALVESLAEYPP
ncbi:MAG TPA: flagellar biosynthetic protein FliR [Polyangiaceae bacterium]|nr:flagellar biosynthetic protein FliR [Polyangiaceae bacterium]